MFTKNNSFVKICVIVAVSLVFVFQACKKDNNGLNQSSIVEHKQRFMLNQTPIETILINPEDKEDEYIKRKEVEICEILIPLLKDKAIRDFIVNEAKANKGEVEYGKFFTQFPNTKSLFADTELAKRFKLGKYVNKRNTEAEYDFVHNGFAYKAVIFLPNYEIITSSEDPVIGPELQIYDDFENDNHDVIFAWEILADGTTREINLGEKDAKMTYTPIIIAAIQTVKELNPTDYTKLPVQKNDLKVPLNPNFDPLTEAVNRVITTTQGIGPRYERWINNYSEVHAAGVQWLQSAGTGFAIGNDPGTGVTNNWRLGRIHKNLSGEYRNSAPAPYQCENQFYNIASSANTFEITGSGLRFKHKVYCNVYEYDWFCTLKGLGSVKFGTDGSTTLEGRRNYQEEWYMFNPGPDCGKTVGPGSLGDPSRATLFPTPRMFTADAFVPYTFDFEDDKGFLTFVRRQN